MENEKTKKPRVRRTKVAVANAIKEAAVKEIKRKGFGNALVTNIMKGAKIEPAVFYKRYENLEKFQDEFVRDYDYWFDDIISRGKTDDATQDGYTQIMQGLLKSLLCNPVMLELLRWEVAEDNETTRRTASLRELQTLPLAEKYAGRFKDSGLDVAAISSLLVGGIYYLMLHRDRSPFSGIDLNTKAGAERISKALDALSQLLFSQVQGEKESERKD